jgi:NitT/TauT family transport system ATP-binding protein
MTNGDTSERQSEQPGMSDGHILRAVNITKRFGGEKEVVALSNFSFDARAGEFISVIGPSGCGKSTLFNIIGGYIKDFEGSILLDGKESVDRRAIGAVFQEESTFPWRTTLQNVAFPLEASGVPKKERLERARSLIRLVGLAGFEDSYPSELSGGMRQRTAIARTLAFDPRILLMDEPFASLDEQTRLLLGDKILQIQQELKQTTLLITHNITEAVQLSDRVLIMTYRPGRLKRIMQIDLPRPRSSEIVSSQRFGELVGMIWNDLREEASKGMIETEAFAR